MALALNTSHPLYTGGNIVALICVDGGVLKDLVTPSRTFPPKVTSPATAGTFGTGAWGEHFETHSSGKSVGGVTLSPGLSLNTNTGATSYTIFVAANSFSAGTNGGAGGDTFQDPSALYAGSDSNGNYTPEIAIFGNGDPAMTIGYNSPPSHGTGGTVVGNGAHSLVLTRPAGDNTSMNLYKDGGATSLMTTGGGWGNGTVSLDTIGGRDTFGTANMQMVYFAVFNKVLSSSEISSLHSSLTGSNAFALVNVTATANVVGAASSQSAVSSAAAITREFTVTAAACTESSSSSAAAIGFGTPGTITTLPLKNNAGMVLANQTGITVYAYKLTGELAVTKTGLTSDASGIVSFTDPATPAGTQYRIVVVIGPAEGMDKVTAA